MSLIPYDGTDDWIEEAVTYAHDCPTHDTISDPVDGCEWCEYERATTAALS
jgi:hypothetical protein